MHSGKIRHIIAIIACLTAFALNSKAQFKEEAFSQTYNDSTYSASADSTDQLFSIKELFRGLSHKQTIKVGTMFAGSVILPGSAQIYNRDYWKLPIVYGGTGALAGTGGYYLHQYNQSKKQYDRFMAEKTAFETANGTEYPHMAPVLNTKAKQTGTWLMLGAGLFYWGSLLDGVINYQTDEHPLPGKATLYSLLVPGLGQIYNGELYKVPIYIGGLMTAVHFLTLNNLNYKRFKRIHNEASQPDNNSPISAETAKWYRDVYRRYRDYSIVATAAVYFLQVIDANVFAYMHDFEVDDNITMNIEPTIICPDNAYALNTPVFSNSNNAVGMRIGFRF